MNKYRKNFPFYKHNPKTIYLDSAASSLKLQSVIDATVNYYETNGANVFRGVYQLSHDATKLYEETRKLAARLINSETKEIIFTKGTTDGLNNVANALLGFIKSGDEIITSELEHHSSILPWRLVANKKEASLKYVPLNAEGKITLENFKLVFNKKTKVVALTQGSNALGYLTPLKEIIKYARAINPNAIFIIDGAQSVPHIKVDVKDLDIDFLAFSAHKMYGPNGVGVLFGKEKHLKELPPFELGGEMAEIVTKDSYTYKEAPAKFEAGTPNVAGVIAFGKALEFYLDNNLDELHHYEMSLKDYALNKLSILEDIEIYNKNAELPLITFNVKGVHPHDIASVLDGSNIAVRAGHHCAQLVNNKLKQISTLRISLAIYNTKEEIDLFYDALIGAIKFFEGFGM